MTSGYAFYFNYSENFTVRQTSNSEGGSSGVGGHIATSFCGATVLVGDSPTLSRRLLLVTTAGSATTSTLELPALGADQRLDVAAGSTSSAELSDSLPLFSRS